MARILIAGSDPSVLSLISLLVKREGHDCQLSTNFEEALDLTHRNPVELVLVERTAPDDAGVRFLHHITQRYPHIATILIASPDDADLSCVMEEAGVYDLILKPVRQQSVAVRVANALRRRELEESRHRHTEQLQTAVSERAESLRQTIRRLENTRGALEQREEQHRELVENANSIILRISPDGQIVYANEYALRFFGYGVDELPGLSILSLLPDREIPGRDPKAFFQSMIDSPDRFRFSESRNIRKDGSLVWINWTHRVIRDDQGRVLEILSIGNDITDRKEVEAHNRLLAFVVERMVENVSITDTDGYITYVNPAFESVTGYSSEEAIGQKHAILSSGKHSEQYYERLWDTITRGNVWRGRFINRKKDGDLYYADGSILPVRSDGKRITHYVSIARDITSKLIMESQLRKAQKLESIGHLTAGISHEINTPMRYIGDNLAYLDDAYRQLTPVLQILIRPDLYARLPDPLRETMAGVDIPKILDNMPAAIAETGEGVSAVNRIVGAMKRFSHPGSEYAVSVDLNTQIRNAATITRNEWKYVARMEFDLDPDIAPVYCYPDDFNQAMLNLILNAAHAVEDRLGRTQNDEMGRIVLSTSRRDDEVEIRVKDTGSGIPEDLQDEIFNPFFTTKEIGRGTGQGLSIVHAAIVKKHCGRVRFTTGPEGTEFILNIPVMPPAGIPDS